jgi:glyoxylase-like metal-dependent hydrolase (beta-lactamase superfamily II)
MAEERIVLERRGKLSIGMERKPMKLIAIDGNSQKLDGGAMYGNAPRLMWEKWSPPDALNRIALACRSLLVITDNGQKILFEAGIGAFFEPKLRERFGVVEQNHCLFDNLLKIGIDPASIDDVVLSHLHFDHAGGILSRYEDGPLRLVFPKARFHASRKNWERSNAPHSRDRASFVPELNRLLSESGRLILVDREPHPALAKLVSFHWSDGHTPGLMMSEIKTSDGPVVFTSDLIPGAPWVHVPISMGYDRYPELVIDEKRQLLDELLPRQAMLFFTHDPDVSCGRLQKDASGKFSTVPVQLSDIH